MGIKKRVCILHHTGGFGGGTKSFIDIIRMLKNKFDIIACIPTGSNELSEILSDIGVKVQYIETKFPVFPSYSGGNAIFSRTMLMELLNWKNMGKFCEEINSLKPDVVIFNSIITIVSAAKLDKKIKKICFIRETIVSGIAKKIFGSILNKYFIAACFLAKAEEKKFKLDNVKTVVIPDCVPKTDIIVEDSLFVRNRLNIKNNDFCVLYMGGDDLIKGPFVILEAMKRLGKGYTLFVAGGFSEIKLSCKDTFRHIFSIKYTYRNIRLSKAYKSIINLGNVEFLGYIHNISDYMNAADVLVFPSVSVHQPRPCIEAGYHQKPVIISDFEETKEYFIDGYNALTFKPGSSKELADKIRFLSRDTKLREQLGMNNYKESMGKHDFESINNMLQEFLFIHIQ